MAEEVKHSEDYNAGFKAGRRDDYPGYSAYKLEGFRGEVSLSTQVALLQQTIENFKNDISEVNVSIKEIRGEIKNINDMANKYRGGLLVVLALGGVIGTLVTLSDKIIHWFH